MEQQLQQQQRIKFSLPLGMIAGQSKRLKLQISNNKQLLNQPRQGYLQTKNSPTKSIHITKVGSGINSEHSSVVAFSEDSPKFNIAVNDLKIPYSPSKQQQSETIQEYDVGSVGNLQESMILDGQDSSKRKKRIQAKETKVLHAENIEQENFLDDLNIHDFPQINYSENTNVWRALFLGLISTHANSYKRYMNKTLNMMQQQNKDQTHQKNKHQSKQPTKENQHQQIKKLDSQISQNISSSQSNSLGDSLCISSDSVTSSSGESSCEGKSSRNSSSDSKKDKSSEGCSSFHLSGEKKKGNRRIKSKIEKAILQGFNSVKKQLANVNTPMVSKNKKPASNLQGGGGGGLTNKNIRGGVEKSSSNLFQKTGQIRKYKAQQSVKGQSNLRLNKHGSSLNGLGRILNIMAMLKRPAQANRMLDNAAKMNEIKLIKKYKAKPITQQKKVVLMKGITDGIMSRLGQQNLKQLLQLNLFKSMDQKDQLEEKILDKYLNSRLNKALKNPHIRLQLHQVGYIDFATFSLLDQIWTEKDEKLTKTTKIRRTKSMVDLETLESGIYKQNVFNEPKYYQLASAHNKPLLNQIIRRKSCHCTVCGGENSTLQKVLTREIFREPLPPFVKSHEEIAYEMRLAKRTQQTAAFKRMQLDTFKNSVTSHIHLIGEDQNESQTNLNELLPAQAESKTEIVNASQQKIQSISDSLDIDFDAVQSSMEKLKKNSQLIRNASSVIKTIQQNIINQKLQQKALEMQGLKDTGKNDGSQNQNSASSNSNVSGLVKQKSSDQNLQEISEEQEDNLPLYRSARVKSNQICALVRDPKNSHGRAYFGSLIKINSITSDYSFQNSPTMPKLQKRLISSSSNLLYIQDQINEKEFEESPLPRKQRRSMDENDDDSSTQKSNNSSLKTSIRSSDLNSEYYRTLKKKAIQRQKKEAFQKLTQKQIIIGAMRADPNACDKLQKVIDKGLMAQGQGKALLRIRNVASKLNNRNNVDSKDNASSQISINDRCWPNLGINVSNQFERCSSPLVLSRPDNYQNKFPSFCGRSNSHQNLSANKKQISATPFLNSRLVQQSAKRNSLQQSQNSRNIDQLQKKVELKEYERFQQMGSESSNKGGLSKCYSQQQFGGMPIKRLQTPSQNTYSRNIHPLVAPKTVQIQVDDYPLTEGFDTIIPIQEKSKAVSRNQQQQQNKIMPSILFRSQPHLHKITHQRSLNHLRPLPQPVNQLNKDSDHNKNSMLKQQAQARIDNLQQKQHQTNGLSNYNSGSGIQESNGAASAATSLYSKALKKSIMLYGTNQGHPHQSNQKVKKASFLEANSVDVQSIL